MRPEVIWNQTNPDGPEIDAPIPSTWRPGVGDPRRPMFMYFDESGNLDFGSGGTPFFVMTCVVARRPFTLSNRLGSLRYDLIEQGHDIEKLHACEDVDEVRRNVYSVLADEPWSYGAYVAYVLKSEVPEEFRFPDAIYAKMFELLVDEVYEQETNDVTSQVIAITDRLPKDAKKRQVTKPLKKYMKEKFQANSIPYLLMHHDSASDMNLQVTDYLCWAAQRDLTQGKDWPMSKVAPLFRERGKVRWSEAE